MALKKDNSSLPAVKIADGGVKIVEKAVAELKPYWRNPRFNEGTVPALAKSIQRYGFTVPIIVDKENVIVAGHARYKAAKLVGLDIVPCIVSDATDKQNKVFRILDNTVQDITLWDEELLGEELKGLFDSQKTIDFFDGTLDVVINLGEVTIINTGEAMNGEGLNKDGIEERVLCPYCGGVVTVDDVIGNLCDIGKK